MMWRILLLAALLSSAAIVFSCADDDDDDDDSATGTWEDAATGLTWSVQASADLLTWAEAVDYCDQLALGGSDDWRLPTIDELRSLINGCAATETDGACEQTDACSDCWNDACDGCEEEYEGVVDNCRFDDALAGGCEEWYWSATEIADETDSAAHVDFFDAAVSTMPKTNAELVRCVR